MTYIEAAQLQWIGRADHGSLMYIYVIAHRLPDAQIQMSPKHLQTSDIRLYCQHRAGFMVTLFISRISMAHPDLIPKP